MQRESEQPQMPAEHDMPPLQNEDDATATSGADVWLDVDVDHASVAAAEIAQLKEQLAAAQDEVAKVRDQSLRSLAEAENIKRRSEKEIQDARKYAVSSLVKDLVDVAEVLHHSTDQLSDEQKQSETVIKIVEGIELTRKELMNVLQKYGVQRIAPASGDAFDHNLQQAISQAPDAQYPKNTVIKMIQAGYTIGDRLIKPALVIVSAGAASE